MDFALPPLPYALDALAPCLSADGLDYHHARIHRAYVEALQAELAGLPEATQPLVQIVLGSSSRRFNLAAQVYSHDFYWRSMTPGGGGPPPPGALRMRIERDFGSYSAFRDAWIRAGIERFGSGYVWLTLEDGRLEIVPTPNAETPLAIGATPLLVVDVWEHAYCLDYRERRDRYLEAFCDALLCWSFAAQNLDGAVE